MTDLETKILLAALKEVGAPYVWQGKGDFLWSPVNAVAHSFLEPHVFDCSGLFTFACWKAGLPDRRLHHSAQTLYDKLLPLPGSSSVAVEVRPVAAFYGKDNKHVSHVAIVFSLYGKGMVVEASGGGHLTVNPHIAAQQGAAVRVQAPSRKDLVGLRLLPSAPQDLL